MCCTHLELHGTDSVGVQRSVIRIAHCWIIEQILTSPKLFANQISSARVISTFDIILNVNANSGIHRQGRARAVEVAVQRSWRNRDQLMWKVPPSVPCEEAQHRAGEAHETVGYTPCRDWYAHIVAGAARRTTSATSPETVNLKPLIAADLSCSNVWRDAADDV